MGKGCLLGFIFTILFVAAASFLSGGTISLDILFASGLAVMIVFAVVYGFVGLLKDFLDE